MPYTFLADTYETECLKVVSVWSQFEDRISKFGRARTTAVAGACASRWCTSASARTRGSGTCCGIDVAAPPLPREENRLAFIRRYAEDASKRLEALRRQTDAWWEGETGFFDVRRSRAWVMTRRLTHTSHHRGQLMAMLRMLGRTVYSNYGPTADTGGLMQDHAPTIYAYSSLDALLKGEAQGGAKAPLTRPPSHPVTERPERMRRRGSA